MREFKFKVWDKRGKQMYTASDIFSYGVGVTEAIDEDGGNILYEEYELLQFIGLKDTNGKEICEGDILLVNGGEKGFEYTGDVYFKGGSFHCRNSSTPDWGDMSNYEIIGNIYENPELIK